jgi:hypothetical protein
VWISRALLCRTSSFLWVFRIYLGMDPAPLGTRCG